MHFGRQHRPRCLCASPNLSSQLAVDRSSFVGENLVQVEKYTAGLNDPNMTASGASKETLMLRDTVLQSIRSFFHDQGYLEVETPIRIPAPTPEAHIDAVASEGWYLQTSPELCMKRLLARGVPRLFQICRCFRSAERGTRHLPEMTLLEWYTANADYRWKMKQVEALVRFVAKRLKIDSPLNYQGKTVDFVGPWDRLTVHDAYVHFTGESAADAVKQDRFDELMAYEIEPRLGIGRPVFLMDYPVEAAALAKIRPGDPPVAERFELYMAGLELCNAFTELTDPVEQRRRFETEIRSREISGKPSSPMPGKFLKDLERMPEATGCALGVDRLVMLCVGAACIDDVVAFTPEML